MEATETSPKPTPMKVGLKYGLMLGIISIAVSIIQRMAGIDPMENSWVQNVINLALTLALVILAHKNFKDTGDGYMSYGQGFLISLITVFVSLAIAAIFTFIYFNFVDPSAFEGIWEKAAEKMAAQGQSEDQIEMGLGIAKRFFWVFFIVGGLFWGCIIGLIVSIFTQKKAPETAF